MLANYLQRIVKIAARARSESKLEGELNQLLKELLSQYEVGYDPIVNETLKAAGLSQFSTDRPDSLFGHVVLDYKKPGLLRTASIGGFKSTIESYLDEASGGHGQSPEECQRWAGILWDGLSIAFCRSDGERWTWTETLTMTEGTLLRLVHTYRSLNRLPLTARMLTDRFGRSSLLLNNVIPVFVRHLQAPGDRTTMLFREWKRIFEQVSSYKLSQLPSLEDWGARLNLRVPDAATLLFAMHTYYSIVVKMLASELLASGRTDALQSPVERLALSAPNLDAFVHIDQLEDGGFYRQYLVNNFLEGDFFSWYTGERAPEMANAIFSIAQTFMEFEPATARLRPEAVKDLLKEFYSGLLDEQVRHDLGEYYTPDWLAQYVLDAADYYGDLQVKVMDPACGSGTFLVECIRRLREACSKAELSSADTLKCVLENVRGMDLNPLAVISARANYILAIADIVQSAGSGVELPVYLADSINIPVIDSQSVYFEYELETEVERLKFRFPIALVRSGRFGELLTECETCINLGHREATLVGRLRQNPSLAELMDAASLDSVTLFFRQIKALHDRVPSWDGIWCRIVKNVFAPASIGKVDLIIGNPPWVRWSRLPEGYRKRVKRFCDHYGLVSGRSYTGGIESDISTVITFSAADNWLNVGGKVAFLITMTVFKSDSATGFRKGILPDETTLRLDLVEDLSLIQPFPDASTQTGLYVATKIAAGMENDQLEVPFTRWTPLSAARVPTLTSLSDIMAQVTRETGVAYPIAGPGSPYFTGTRDEFDSCSFLRGRSPYLVKAHRGVVTDLARVYWVKVMALSEDGRRALIRTLTGDELKKAHPVNSTDGHWVESELLHPLARGRDVGRFSSLTEGWYELIPNDHYSRIIPEDEFAATYPLAYDYLSLNRERLLERSTYKRYLAGSPFYSVYCIGEYSFSPFKVAWLEVQDPAKFRASVLGSYQGALPAKPYVPDHKLYYISLESKMEAHYVCAFLNSQTVRTWLGGFSLGKQIGSSILEHIALPSFDASDPHHVKLAGISRLAHELRAGITNAKPLEGGIEREINSLVEGILGRR